MRFISLKEYLEYGDDPEKDIAFSNKSRKLTSIFLKK